MPDPVPETIVDGRYRILSRLGAGGMADVFLAEDEQLNRKIALKLLHHRFAEDPGFVERFKREAQAAAGLQHPNVVSVYDRGRFEDTYYIAMEYLPGRSLKQLIREEAPLDPVRTIDIALQILNAARFAHRQGVIHRDLKPHNVIVDDSDHAKVTDFGIARAGASDMTETGSIMGTAQYLSPEQAQGRSVTAASDLYSIGVVMYEMLTGRVPFDGESPVTIALKHVSEAPVPPRQFNPNIPPELEQTVLWVLNKEAVDRPKDADQLITVLEHIREAITSAGAGQHTARMAAVAAAGAAAGAGGAAIGAEAYRRAQHQHTNGTGDLAAVVPVEERPGRGWAPWGWVLLVLVLIAAAAAAAYFLTRPKQVLVPHVRGEQVAQARATLQAAGFQVDTVPVPNHQTSGIVLGEDPSAGSRTDKGSTVTLTVSTGPGDANVPSVQGLPVSAAITLLKRNHLKAGRQLKHYSTNFPAGQVTGTDPRVATALPRGSAVTLLVSAGPPPVNVPNVTGETETAAATALTKAGFNVNNTTEPSNSAAPGTVISQRPGSGTSQPSGSTVTIVVATAPATATVPNVTGDPASGAVSALTAAGFNVVQKTTKVKQQNFDGIVVSQKPGSNATAKKGSTVTITIGHFTAGNGTSTSSTSTTTSTSTPANTGTTPANTGNTGG